MSWARGLGVVSVLEVLMVHWVCQRSSQGRQAHEQRKQDEGALAERVICKLTGSAALLRVLRSAIGKGTKHNQAGMNVCACRCKRA